MYRFLCGRKFSVHFSKYQGACLLVRVCVVLKETAKLSSKVTVPFCILTSNTFGVVSAPDFGHSSRSVVVSCFNLHFPS